MELKGSKTEKNLLTAFAGESQARNKYTYFASIAKKEGYEQIAAIFEETAGQERAHAKQEFKYLVGGEAEIMAAFPAGKIGNTLENLKAAAAGEHYETNEMYPGFAEIADEEGFKAIATTFRCIAVAEKRHEDRYMALINNVSNSQVFKKGKPVRWVCRNCGYVHEGPEAPKLCAACVHPQAYFELDALNY